MYLLNMMFFISSFNFIIPVIVASEEDCALMIGKILNSEITATINSMGGNENGAVDVANQIRLFELDCSDRFESTDLINSEKYPALKIAYRWSQVFQDMKNSGIPLSQPLIEIYKENTFTGFKHVDEDYAW